MSTDRPMTQTSSDKLACPKCGVDMTNTWHDCSATSSDKLVERLHYKVPSGHAEFRLVNPDGPQAADRITALQSRLERVTEALKQIATEAERPKGSWVHLKRAIGLNARAALSTQDEAGEG